MLRVGTVSDRPAWRAASSDFVPVARLRLDSLLASAMLRRGRARPALVAQRIEHLTTDQKVGGSNPSERANVMSRDTVDRCLGTSLHVRASSGVGLVVC